MIIFTVDYRGVLTNEVYYKAGTVTAHESAAALVSAGRAEYINQSSQPVIDELRQRAKDVGIKGYARMKKETLIERLANVG